MSNAKNAGIEAFHRILLVGPTGAGKSSQMWTLPGRKFVYIFDPNSLSALRGCDIEYERFLPDVQEIDMSLKGFNKGSRSDAPKRKREPTVWNKWADDFNDRYERGFFRDFDWLCFDSFTFITKAIMDRNLYINGRYGDIEDRGDFRIVGAKMAEVFGTIAGMDINIFATGHIDTYQDEDTKKIRTQLMLPGKARKIIPLQFTDVWLAQTEEVDKRLRYKMRTVPDPKGLQDIRSSLSGLEVVEDITIGDGKTPLAQVHNPEGYGIGKLLKRTSAKRPTAASAERNPNGLRERLPEQRERTGGGAGGGV